ncbi:LemA family protein [Flaviflexus equikiangi]|uniref:LemA family protein n=1 Tax=Flaviflexus equikiangi TaxID=2758573 RepID=A0ABS2THW2_9ACTO|nr:LemA family protein [Flaviflexus equikiangi]MBM9433938.1 LemA family protein [Flaviflexus equikiangi]
MNVSVVVGLIVLLIVILVVWVVSMYNRLIRLRNQVQESWKQVDVELHRRYQLIPNLIETVKGYASHEQAVLAEVTAMRERAQQGRGTGERAQREGDLSRALAGVVALAENYPDLKASGPFRDLQAELANTEDRIAAGRRFYNSNVSGLNTTIESFPGNIIASMFSFRRAEYFETAESVRQAPRVSFTDTDGHLGRYGADAWQPAPEPGAPGFGGQRGGFDPRRDGGRAVDGGDETRR